NTDTYLFCLQFPLIIYLSTLFFLFHFPHSIHIIIHIFFISLSLLISSLKKKKGSFIFLRGMLSGSRLLIKSIFIYIYRSIYHNMDRSIILINCLYSYFLSMDKLLVPRTRLHPPQVMLPMFAMSIME
ncbi:hypothetical protein Leryth_022039, partial [Lithospermum erythrorhizon]